MATTYRLVLMALFVTASMSFADEHVDWIDGGHRGNWSDETSWNTLKVPSLQDAVQIRSGMVNLDRDYSVTSLEVHGGLDKPVHFEVPQAGKLLVVGSLRLSHVHVFLNGTVEVTGDVEIGAGTEISGETLRVVNFFLLTFLAGNGIFVVHGKFDTGDLLKLLNSGVEIKVQPGSDLVNMLVVSSFSGRIPVKLLMNEQMQYYWSKSLTSPFRNSSSQQQNERRTVKLHRSQCLHDNMKISSSYFPAAF
eukprot:288830-Hanusia_phi.AAC.4